MNQETKPQQWELWVCGSFKAEHFTGVGSLLAANQPDQHHVPTKGQDR